MIHDPVFWSSVKLTLIFVIGSGIIAQTVLGMALALLGQRAHFTVRARVGSIVILAWVLPRSPWPLSGTPSARRAAR